MKKVKIHNKELRFITIVKKAIHYFLFIFFLPYTLSYLGAYIRKYESEKRKKYYKKIYKIIFCIIMFPFAFFMLIGYYTRIIYEKNDEKLKIYQKNPLSRDISDNENGVISI